jgi:hypothetical protein
MKQISAIGSRLRNMRLCGRVSVSSLALVLMILAWSGSSAAPPQPDLRLDRVFPPDHPFSNPFKPRLFPRYDEGLVSVNRPHVITPSLESPKLDMRVPISTSLQTGYVHSFQPDKHGGRVALDGLGVMPLTRRLALFGEAHMELEKLRISDLDWLQTRSDWSGGFGVRGMTSKNVLLGVNFFLDESRLDGRPHKSGGVGFEMAAKISDVPREVIDLAVNLHRGGGIDARTGISFPLREDVDWRLSLGKYRFYDGEYLLGWTAGTDVSVCGELLNFSYEFNQDRDRAACHTFGLSLSANLNLEDLFSGSWPFRWPNKQSPHEDRFADRMAHRVKRSWHRPDSFVRFAARSDAMWNAPGRVRWDIDHDFSPTEEVVKAFFVHRDNKDSATRKEKNTDASVLDQLGYLLVGAAASVTTGVLEYGYRSLFGPFETDTRPHAH